MGDGVLHVPSSESLLLLEELKQGVGIGSVDLHFLEAGELSAEVELAELMDALVGAGSLLTELVAGEVEDDEVLRAVLLVEFLQLFILRCEAALGCCVHDEQHFVGVLFQRNVLSFSVLDSEIINCFHCFFLGVISDIMIIINVSHFSFLISHSSFFYSPQALHTFSMGSVSTRFSVSSGRLQKKSMPVSSSSLRMLTA